MSIYISTGGWRTSTAFECCDYLMSNGFCNVELTAGKWDNLFYSDEDKVKKILQQYSKRGKLLLHNYFPPREDKLVLNLGSTNQNVWDKTLEHFRRLIRLSEAANSRYISIHAGFLSDPVEKDLDPKGSGFNSLGVEDYNSANENFRLGCAALVEYGIKFGVELLVENNVCTNSNYKRHQCSPFMFSGYQESLDFVNSLPKECGVLLDIGHLNVSSTTMKYSGINLIKKIKDKIWAFHLSHNLGLVDSNYALKEKTTFLQEAKQIPCRYSTLEVYDYSPEVLTNCVNLASSLSTN